MNGPIEVVRCDFKFECPKQWEQMLILENPRERFCNQRQRTVYFAASRTEFIDFASAGRCIAARVHDAQSNKFVMIAGDPKVPSDQNVMVLGDPNDALELARALDARQRAHDDRSLKNIPGKRPSEH